MQKNHTSCIFNVGSRTKEREGGRVEEIHSFLSYAETKEGVHTERWSSGRRGFDTGGQGGAKTTFLV